MISLSYIGGRCPLPKNMPRCGMEQPYSLTCPEVTTKILNFDRERLKEVRDNFQNRFSRSPEFWKIRIITHLAAAPQFFSATFIPFDLTATQTWFVQKNRLEPPYNGFFAPFLSKQQQTEFGCIDNTDPFSIISSEDEIVDSIQNIESTVYSDTLTLLSYFLQDSLTGLIGLTYLNYYGKQTTRFWCKASLLKASFG